MSTAALQTQPVADTVQASPEYPALQRRCECGESAGVSGACPACDAAQRNGGGIQARPLLDSPGDRYEREAENVADQVVRKGGGPATPDLSHRVTPLVQRSAEPKEQEEEEEGSEPVQARSRPDRRPSQNVSAGFDARLSGALNGGDGIEGGVRGFMEHRFGADFSQIRIHIDAGAASLSRDVQAQAFTVGRHIFFGRGQYEPGTDRGRHLLAHELTHTIQQTGPAPTVGVPSVQRRGFFAELAGLFAGDDFSDAELQAYVASLMQTGRIEDYTDSDNKARAIVKKLQNGDDPFALTAPLKTLLIKEMQSGATLVEDERAILFLLETATAEELAAMFAPGGLTTESLLSDLDGPQNELLRQFFEQRFDGGLGFLEMGIVTPLPYGYFGSVVGKARARLRVLEKLLAATEGFYEERRSLLFERNALDVNSIEQNYQEKQRIERRIAGSLNKKPVTVEITDKQVIFHVRFHVRFEDPSMAGRFAELTSSLRSGMETVWNQRLRGPGFGERDFSVEPTTTLIDMNKPRDWNYWLITVRPDDSGEVNYPGCTFDKLVPGVPTSATMAECDGGVMSIPPRHITLPGVLGHELLHLFGLVDRYLIATSMDAQGKPLSHLDVPTRDTPGRRDPLGAEEGTILEEDLAQVFENLGLYEKEITQRGKGLDVEYLRAEIARLKKIVEAGYDPDSLLPLRGDFVPEAGRNAEDL